ncbi:MAG: acyl-CoA dehydrogenase family protein [Actinomycetota bacterium]
MAESEGSGEIMDKDLFFTPEHEMLRQSVREFVEGELVPHADEWEAEGMFPDWVFRRLGELGYLGLHFPEEYGGGGGDYFTNIVLIEELAKCGSFGVNTGVAVQIGMATPPILAFGTEEQKRSTWCRPSRERRSPAWGSPSRRPDRTWPA